jgi:hypothetical protein
MRRSLATGVLVLLAAAPWAGAQYTLNNEMASNPSQTQNTQLIGGGSAVSDSDSSAISVSEGGDATGGSSSSSSTSSGGTGLGYSQSSLSLTTVTNVKNRTAPTGTYPPYLPMWNHAGWGTTQAYFPNGPTSSDVVYQRIFDPLDQDDMDELRAVLTAVPYDSPLDWFGAVANGIGVIFGAPDNYHHGRGFTISNSIARHRRTEGKPLIVIIDSYVDPQLLAENGYTYAGRVSIEGRWERNWDQVYDAAVAETMPWDVDILLISGGMRGVTVGSNLTLPSLGFGYSQLNYSVSAGAGYASGVTEGKGKAVLSASGYRFDPELLVRRRIPTTLYERIRVRPKPAAAAGPAPATPAAAAAAPAAPTTTTGTPSPTVGTTAAAKAPATPRAMAPETVVKPKSPGIEISSELYQMAGFTTSQAVDNVAVR